MPQQEIIPIADMTREQWLEKRRTGKGADTMSEVWRDVVGYEGWYEVSDQGRVKRIARGHGARPGRVMNGSLWEGYPAVVLSRPGSGHRVRVHVLVCAAFIGPRPEGREVNHKDLTRTNNRLSNLEYVTHAENVRHFFRNGTRRTVVPDNRGVRNGNAKLCPAAVQDIRRMAADGLSDMEIAFLYGVSRRTVNGIRTRTGWRHVA